MKSRRLFTLIGLIVSLVLSLTIPAPAQKSSPLLKSGKATKSDKFANPKLPKGKGPALQQTFGITPNVTDCAVKTPIAPGVTVNGTLTTSDCILTDTQGGISYYDEYTFSASAGQTLSVAMSSAVFDTYLILLNPNNTAAGENDDIDFPNNTNSRIPVSGSIAVSQTGTYAILANGFDNTDVGPYSLTLTFGGGGAVCPPTPIPITNGQTLNGTLAADDCSFSEDNSRYHVYSFSASAGQQVAITMTGTSPVDPYLILEAPDGDTIAEDDNGGGGTSARIPPIASTFGSLPATGTYLIYANTALGNQFGNYSLTLTFSGATCPSAPITAGQTINGSLGASDCRLPFDGSFFDAYTFSGTAGQQISIGQSSGDFDSFLLLLSPTGTALSGNDNDGGGSNARIPATGLFTLPSTGTYTILANSALANMTGAYSVSLNSGTTSTSVQLTFATYAANESAGAVSIGISRTGDTTSVSTVGFATSDTAGLNNCSFINGVASARCDYITSVGTVRFAAGETSKTVSIPLVDDAYAEGDESFTFTLSNASGATLGGLSTATVTIQDNEATNGANPIDGTAFFVRQQYLDFLGREPDPPGFAAWQAVINNCPPGDTTCDRIHVSSGFFRSPEFQDRGYFVYRFYSVAFGRKPLYAEFIPDLAKVSGFLSDSELEAAKVAFVAEFMTRSEFTNKYNGTTDTEYVDLLLSTAGITHAARAFWIAALGNGTRTRAQVLREISESTEVSDKFRNEAFVVMQYFGYLRREPDAAYLQWITHLNTTGDFRSMINGFMNSAEYRARFGQN